MCQLVAASLGMGTPARLGAAGRWGSWEGRMSAAAAAAAVAAVAASRERRGRFRYVRDNCYRL